MPYPLLPRSGIAPSSLVIIRGRALRDKPTGPFSRDSSTEIKTHVEPTTAPTVIPKAPIMLVEKRS